MNPQGLPPEIAGILGIIIAVACVVLVIVFTIYIFYLLTLQKALNRCSPRNRLMEPAMVWLYLIPCFNLIWQFFIATRVPGSLQNEFRDRNRDDGSDYGRSIAMTAAVLNIINIPISQAGNVFNQNKMPEVGMIVSGVSLVISLIAFILFIVFWVKIANYSAMLGQDDGGYRERPRYEGYDDDDDRGGRGPYGDAPRSPPSEGIKESDAGRYQ